MGGPKPAAKTTQKKKAVSREPDKWINGRSGPQINPAWSAWKKNN